MKELGERIKNLRISKGLSQEALGSELRLSKQTISNYENGDRDPGLDTIIKLSDIFNVDTDYLLCKSEVKNIANSNKIQDLLKMQTTDWDNKYTAKLEDISREFYTMLKLFLGKNNQIVLFDLTDTLLKELAAFLVMRDTDTLKRIDKINKLNEIQKIILNLSIAYEFGFHNFSETNPIVNTEHTTLPWDKEKEV